MSKEKEKWYIAEDSLPKGYRPVGPIDKDDMHIPFDTEALATAEMEGNPEFYEDCFVCKATKVGFKVIYCGDNE